MNDDGKILGRRERAVLLLILAAFFASGLFDHSFWGPNDCREGAMIWDMVQSGRWVTPTLNGVPYLEKPPLLHWTGVIFCRLAGTVNEGLLRLPAALYGFGAVLLVWRWGRRLGRERAGLAAAFLCATSLTFMEYSKIVLTDACLSFMVMWSLTLFWNAREATRGRTWRYALFILVSALSFYAKGLLGPGFVWVSVGAYLLYRREWKLAFGLPLIFLPVFLLVLAPWARALWNAGGMDFLRGVFWDNQFGRFLTFGNQNLPRDPYFVHKEPIYYYLLNVPVMLVPWILLAAPALVRWFRRGQGLDAPLAVFMRFCLLGMLLVLHASSAKVGVYALPLLPIVFLMTAVWIEDAAERWTSKWERWPLALTARVLVAPPLLASIFYFLLFLLPQAFLRRHLGNMDLVRDLGAARTALTEALAVALLILTPLVWRRLRTEFRRGERARAFLWMPAAWAAALMLASAILFPIYDSQRTSRPFAELLSAEMAKGRQIALGVSEEKYIGAFTFYTGRRLPVAGFTPFLRELLDKTEVPVGILVKRSDLEQYGAEFGLDAYPALKPDHPGYMSDKFRLLIRDPI
jgi:4-amino-4-deoxy-L-arabinose transferase-like glycosyltransferase